MCAFRTPDLVACRESLDHRVSRPVKRIGKPCLVQMILMNIGNGLGGGTCRFHDEPQAGAVTD